MNDSKRYAQFDGLLWHNITSEQFQNGGSAEHDAVAFWIVNTNGLCQLAQGVDCSCSDEEGRAIEEAWFEDDRVDESWPEDTAYHAQCEMSMALAEGRGQRMYDGFSVLRKG